MWYKTERMGHQVRIELSELFSKLRINVADGRKYGAPGEDRTHDPVVIDQAKILVYRRLPVYANGDLLFISYTDL